MGWEVRMHRLVLHVGRQAGMWIVLPEVGQSATPTVGQLEHRADRALLAVLSGAMRRGRTTFAMRTFLANCNVGPQLFWQERSSRVEKQPGVMTVEPMSLEPVWVVCAWDTRTRHVRELYAVQPNET